MTSGAVKRTWRQLSYAGLRAVGLLVSVEGLGCRAVRVFGAFRVLGVSGLVI